MSQTSKVNPSLRKEILNLLDTYGKGTNTQIYFSLASYPSIRKVQEATQKLTKDGTLVRTGKKFSVATTSGIANAATV